MKTRAIVIRVIRYGLLVSGILGAAYGAAAAGCLPTPPVPPSPGCKAMRPVCICDGEGHCSVVYVCENY